MKAIFILRWRLVLTKVTERINTVPIEPMPIALRGFGLAATPAPLRSGYGGRPLVD